MPNPSSTREVETGRGLNTGQRTGICFGKFPSTKKYRTKIRFQREFRKRRGHGIFWFMWSICLFRIDTDFSSTCDNILLLYVSSQAPRQRWVWSIDCDCCLFINQVTISVRDLSDISLGLQTQLQQKLWSNYFSSKILNYDIFMKYSQRVRSQYYLSFQRERWTGRVLPFVGFLQIVVLKSPRTFLLLRCSVEIITK